MWTAATLVVFIAIAAILPQSCISEPQDSLESSDVEASTPWTMLYHGTDYLITTDNCFTYFGPEGKRYVVDYVAGGGGFQPVHAPSKRKGRGAAGQTKHKIGNLKTDSVILKTLLQQVEEH